jgi:hypothetical protein
MLMHHMRQSLRPTFDRVSLRSDYPLDGRPSKVLAGEYRTTLPNERVIAEESEKTRTLRQERSARSAH